MAQDFTKLKRDKYQMPEYIKQALEKMVWHLIMNRALHTNKMTSLAG
jgi:hypothetical protein